MKTTASLLTLAAALISAAAADSVRFSEVLRDVEVCERFEGVTECNVVQRNSGRFSARVTVPGLAAKFIDSGTTLGVRIGGYEFEAAVGDATSSSANRASYRLVEEDFDTGRLIRLGTITFSRARDVMRVTGSFTRLPSGIVAEGGSWEEDGRGTTDFAARVDELAYGKTVYFKARTREKKPRDPEDEPLRTITVAGSADLTRPTLKIAAPRNRTIATGDGITFQGTAKDNVGVSEVQYRVGTEDWFTADGTTNWMVLVPLDLGTNVIQVKALDLEGIESKIATRTVIRQPTP